MTKLEARMYSLDDILAMDDTPTQKSTGKQYRTYKVAEYAKAKGEPDPATKSIAESLSWDVCVKYEPRLLGLVRRIEAIKRKNFEVKGKHTLRYRYAQDCWYGMRGRSGIKEELNRIIGWTGDSPYKELRDLEAHDICYRHLFRLLSE